MLMIRWQRIGSKNRPFFRLVVQERRSKLNGKALELLGWRDPLKHKFSIKAERLNYWRAHGAQPSDSVRAFLRNVMKETANP